MDEEKVDRIDHGVAGRRKGWIDDNWWIMMERSDLCVIFLWGVGPGRTKQILEKMVGQKWPWNWLWLGKCRYSFYGRVKTDAPMVWWETMVCIVRAGMFAYCSPARSGNKPRKCMKMSQCSTGSDGGHLPVPLEFTRGHLSCSPAEGDMETSFPCWT